MFEGGKCNPIFLFIFLNVESLGSFSEGGKTRKSPRSEKNELCRAIEEESSSPVSEEIKVKTGALEMCLLKITLTDRLPV